MKLLHCYFDLIETIDEMIIENGKIYISVTISSHDWIDLNFISFDGQGTMQRLVKAI